MEENQTENPIKPVENRKPDGTFGPGNNANPLGRPKGQSLKEFWRQRFQEMTEEEKIAFSFKVGNDTLWKMAEGNPKQDLEHSGNLTIAEVIKKLKNGRTIGQAVATGLPLQNPQQEEGISSIPAEQSPAALPTEQVVSEHYTEEPPTGLHD